MAPQRNFCRQIEWRGASRNEVCAIRTRASQNMKDYLPIQSAVAYAAAKIERGGHVCGEIYIAANVIGS